MAPGGSRPARGGACASSGGSSVPAQRTSLYGGNGYFNNFVPPILRNGKVVITFPLRCPATCVAGGCMVSFKNSSWTSFKNSLFRHLNTIHKLKMKPDECVLWCGVCNLDLGCRVTGHHCFGPHLSFYSVTNDRCNFPCTKCPESFPSYRGLSNHLNTHKKKEIQDKYDAKNGIVGTAGANASRSSNSNQLPIPSTPSVSDNVNSTPSSPPEMANARALLVEG